MGTKHLSGDTAVKNQAEADEELPSNFIHKQYRASPVEPTGATAE